jgi:hypothetical protein
MYEPLLNQRDRPLIEEPTWRSIIVSYAMMTVIPLLLWVLSQPLDGMVALAAIGGLFVGGRRVYRLIHCFSDYQEFAFNLGGKVQITVTQLPSNDAD